MSLFQLGPVILHSGEQANWKVDCDRLSAHDFATLAMMLADIVWSFGRVEGVPTGGWRIANALKPYASEGSQTLLIVDDVLTTGASMEEHRAGRDAIGAVLFARGPVPPWVTALWTYHRAEPPIGGQA